MVIFGMALLSALLLSFVAGLAFDAMAQGALFRLPARKFRRKAHARK